MLLWVDIATTGLDWTRHHLLEVAVVPTTDQLQFILDTPERGWHYVVAPPVDPWETWDLTDDHDQAIAFEHNESGLLEAINSHGAPSWWVDNDLSDRVSNLTLGEQVTLAGADIARFDSHWLSWHLPKVSQFINPFTIDVMEVGRALAAFTGDDLGLRVEASRAGDRALEAVDLGRQLRSYLLGP